MQRKLALLCLATSAGLWLSCLSVACDVMSELDAQGVIIRALQRDPNVDWYLKTVDAIQQRELKGEDHARENLTGKTVLRAGPRGLPPPGLPKE